MSLRRYALPLSGAVLLLGAQPAQAETEHGRGLALFRSGNFSAAVQELSRVASTGCKPVALYLLGAAHSQLYDAHATIAAVSRARSCRNPGLASNFIGSSNSLLLWAREWLKGRRERMKLEFSDDDVQSHDVLLLVAQKERAAAEQKEIDALVATVDQIVPQGAPLVTEAAKAFRPECDMYGYLSEPCQSRDDPPAIALPPE